MLYRDDFSSPSPPLAAHLASHEPRVSSARHPSIVPSPVTAAGDTSGDRQDINTLVMQLSRASATIHEMHVELDCLRSSLEAMDVAVAEADQKRVVAQTEIASNYCYYLI